MMLRALWFVLSFPFKLIPCLVHVVTEPMRLDEVRDYETYWRRREQIGHAGTLSRARILSRYIKPGQSLLDVGCGDGELLSDMQQRGVQVEGVETSDQAIGICRRKGLSVRKLDLLQDGASLPGEWDYISALCVFEHIQDPEIMMKRFAGHFRQGVFVAIPNIQYLPYVLRLACGRFPITTIFFHMREHIRFWTVTDFRQWARAMGFEVVHVISNDDNPLARAFPRLFATNLVFQLVAAAEPARACARATASEAR